jgi:hypothetical protein
LLQARKMDKKPESPKPKKPDIKIKSIDIDKAEYQEIVLSQSNYHDRKYSKYDY